MNVFFTNINPHKCANEHCNVHQVKMILEYSQLLSTAHQLMGNCYATQAAVYKPTHQNHPSAVWVRDSVDHYAWLYQCLMHLHKLYADRTGKEHKSIALRHWLKRVPGRMECNGFSLPPVCAPDKFKRLGAEVGVCEAYMSYLNSKFAEWQSRPRPMPVEWTTRKPAWYRSIERTTDN